MRRGDDVWSGEMCVETLIRFNFYLIYRHDFLTSLFRFDVKTFLYAL